MVTISKLSKCFLMLKVEVLFTLIGSMINVASHFKSESLEKGLTFYWLLWTLSCLKIVIIIHHLIFVFIFKVVLPVLSHNSSFFFLSNSCHIHLPGHGELLELRLLEKSARHDFIIARHRSSSWRVFDKLLDNELICGSTGFEQ